MCCTVEDFGRMMEFDQDYAIDYMVYPVEDEVIEENNLEKQFRIFSSSILHSSVNISVEDEPNSYSFSQDNMLKILTPLKKRKVNAWWILLDSASTIDVFCNLRLLTNIHCVNIRQ